MQIKIDCIKIASYGSLPIFRATAGNAVWDFSSANVRGARENLETEAIEALAQAAFMLRGIGRYRPGAGTVGEQIVAGEKSKSKFKS